MSEELKRAVENLLESITTDMTANGDILSRDTIRRADEVRLMLSRERKNDQNRILVQDGGRSSP